MAEDAKFLKSYEVEPLPLDLSISAGNEIRITCHVDADTGIGFLLVNMGNAVIQTDQISIGERVLRALPIRHVPIQKVREDGQVLAVAEDGRRMLFNAWFESVRVLGIDPFAQSSSTTGEPSPQAAI